MTKREKQLAKIESLIQGQLDISTAEDRAAFLDDVLAAEADPPEPEIKPGELVYAWDGTARPEHPEIAYYMVKRETGHHVRYGHRTIGDPGDEVLSYEHVERFYMPFDWKRWPGVKWVVDFDSTERFMLDSDRCPWGLEDRNRFSARVIRILERPEGR